MLQSIAIGFSNARYAASQTASRRQTVRAAARSTSPARSAGSFAQSERYPGVNRLNSEEKVRARIQDRLAAETVFKGRGRFDRTITLDGVHPLAMRTGGILIDKKA